MTLFICAHLCLNLYVFMNQYSSIHEREYEMHLKEATFSPIAQTKQNFVPIRIETRGMLKNYYGYLPYWTDTTYYQYFQMELLTHIAYFSVDIDPATGNLGGIPNAARFYKICNYGHDRGLRIHMTYTIFNNSNVTTFLNNAMARSNAINNIRNFMTNYGIEGANIDFEFVTSAVRDSFSKFINDLANTLWTHPSGRKELYMATPAVPEWYPGYNVSYLSTYSDGLFIMAYDYHWSGSSTAGPVSPCIPSSFWGQYCAAKTIGSYKSYGANSSKLILGLPYYGYDWPTQSQNIGSATTGTGSAVIYYYAFQNAITYGRLWDSYSLTPWYRYYSSQWHQCWYDDSVSLDIKYGMVNDSMLQGSGCWALGYDVSYDHIWNAIRRNFWIEPPTRHFTVEVNIDDLNVHDGPGTEYKILTTAELGSKFVAFDYYYNWYKVYFPSRSGPYYAWMSGGDGITNQFMKGTTQNTILRVYVDLLNVREGPGTSYPVITQITDGQVFVADSFNSDWARIYLQTINNYTKGWIYHPYTNIIQNPEDDNTYDCNLLELTYPSTVQELDTFSVALKIKNTGFGPFDSLVYLKGSNKSPFYNATTWLDTTRAGTSGFPGLPSQTYYISAIFKAPDVINPTTVSDTFQFERKTNLFGPSIIVTVIVNPVAISEQKYQWFTEKIIARTIFTDEIELLLLSPKDFYEIFIYDIQGRMVVKLRINSDKKIKIGKELKSGVYFLVAKIDNKTFKQKIIKIR